MKYFILLILLTGCDKKRIIINNISYLEPPVVVAAKSTTCSRPDNCERYFILKARNGSYTFITSEMFEDLQKGDTLIK